MTNSNHKPGAHLNYYYLDVTLREDEATGLTDGQRDTLNKLLDQNHAVFNEYGPSTQHVEHCINLTDHTPIAATPYRLSPEKKCGTEM